MLNTISKNSFEKKKTKMLNSFRKKKKSFRTLKNKKMIIKNALYFEEAETLQKKKGSNTTQRGPGASLIPSPSPGHRTLHGASSRPCHITSRWGQFP